MKKFILQILYFIFPIIIIAYPIDYSISYYLKKSNECLGEFEVWNDIYSSNINSDIVIYGSSRAWVHINPKIISDSLHLSTYNLGIDGHNFWLQYLRHRELLKYNKIPKKIILSVDVFSLQKRIDLYQSNQFLPFMLWNNNLYEFTKSYVGYQKLDYYIPLIRYSGKNNSLRMSIKTALEQTPIKKYRDRGYLGMNKKWNSDFEKAKIKMNHYEIILDSQSIKLFEKFIQECKTSNIELTLVYTPEYIEGQKFIKNRNQIINIYKHLSKKYQINFYDYSDDEICLNNTFFYNSNHLNKNGSEIFSRKLAHDLKIK